MKRVLTFLLTLAVVLTLCASISAEEATESGDLTVSAEITQVMDSLLSDEEKALFENCEDIDLFDMPIVRVYYHLFWEWADRPTAEHLALADEYETSRGALEYYVLSAVPYKIRVLPDKMAQINTSYSTPQYLKDICALSGQVMVDEKPSDVTGIYCFDCGSSYFGCVVYIETENGTLVKYYEDRSSEAMLFSESDFRKHAGDYYAYITSYEYNYNEKGEPLGGQSTTFKECLENPPAKNTSDNGADHKLPVGFFVLLGIGITAIGFIVLYKKRRAAV